MIAQNHCKKQHEKNNAKKNKKKKKCNTEIIIDDRVNFYIIDFSRLLSTLTYIIYHIIIMQNHISTLDLQRGPRQLPKGYKSKMIFPLKSLQFHRCPICLSYMKKTYIVMECLHRFCGDCIQKSLRMGMKECPSCRVHIPSRRSLRPDRTYDTIMESMYGDIQRLEEREEKQIEEYNKKNNMNNSYSQSQRLRKMQKSMQKVRIKNII